MQLLRAAGYPTARWRNGGGTTKEIAAATLPGEGFLWRLSLATIAADGPFSCFPGIDRTLSLVEGTILLNGTVLDDRSPPFRFDGEAQLDCRLLPPSARREPTEKRSFAPRAGLRRTQAACQAAAASALALNVMTRRDHAHHCIEHVDGKADRRIAVPERGAVFLFARTGGVIAGGEELARHDTMRLVPGDPPVALHQKESARTVLVTVRAVSMLQCAVPPAGFSSA